MSSKELVIRFEADMGNEVCLYVYYGGTHVARLWCRKAPGFSSYASQSVLGSLTVTGHKAELGEVVDRFVQELERCIAEGLV